MPKIKAENQRRKLLPEVIIIMIMIIITIITMIIIMIIRRIMIIMVIMIMMLGHLGAPWRALEGILRQTLDLEAPT